MTETNVLDVQSRRRLSQQRRDAILLDRKARRTRQLFQKRFLIRQVLEILESEQKYSPLTLHDVCSYDNVKARVIALAATSEHDQESRLSSVPLTEIVDSEPS